jgi:CubicO group peptidase (beta-lactamase class C family)
MKKLFISFLLLPVVTLAQKDISTLIDNYMQAQVNINEFTGTVLVAQKGTIIYEKAFGMADREWNIPNTVQSKFEIGSITKQFTAACILQLAEQGKLSLDDKLSKYFADFPKADSVTIHMLLTHTSGIKDYTQVPEFSKVCTLRLEKDSMVALIKKQPFGFSPGTEWSYSSSGYFLLGYIIEKVSGKSYNDYVANNIIQKAGLKNTCVNRWDSILLYRAKGYRKTTNGWKNAYYISMEGPYSAGAIISTIEDLYQWDNALFSNKIISAASFSKMTTPYKAHYGYGLFIDSFQHHLEIGHSGGINGFNSFLGRFPTDDVVVAGLSNEETANTEGIVNALAAIVFGIPVTVPYKHTEVKVDPSILKRYVGAYKQTNAQVDTLIIKEGKLYIHTQNGGGEYEFKPESEKKIFYALNPDAYQYEFEVDDKGKVTKVYYISAGIKNEIKKI